MKRRGVTRRDNQKDRRLRRKLTGRLTKETNQAGDQSLIEKELHSQLGPLPPTPRSHLEMCAVMSLLHKEMHFKNHTVLLRSSAFQRGLNKTVKKLIPLGQASSQTYRKNDVSLGLQHPLPDVHGALPCPAFSLPVFFLFYLSPPTSFSRSQAVSQRVLK